MALISVFMSAECLLSFQACFLWLQRDCIPLAVIINNERRNAWIRSTNTITAGIRSQVFSKVYLKVYFAFVIRLACALHVIINMLFRKLWSSTFDRNFTHEWNWLQTISFFEFSHCLSVSGLFSRSIHCVKPIMNWQKWCQQLHNAERLTCSLHWEYETSC